MNTYRFAGLPSNSSVAGIVTLLVSAWFVLAGGAILTDQHSEQTVENARAPAARLAEIPAEARMTIVVEARRSTAI
jgi:hypothetical protein